MQLNLLFGYPDFIGRRFAWAGYGSGPSSYVTGGDQIVLPTYNSYIDAVFGSVYTVSGNYIVTPQPLGFGVRQKWNLKWNTVPASGSSLNSVTTRLGSAANYALLGASGITNTGSSVIAQGNIGSAPTASITGFPPGVLTSPSVIDNTDASAAQTALAAAIVYYQGLTPTLSGLADLSTGGNGSTASTYTPGNYFGGALSMPTGIILDAQGNPNAQFVFVATSTINLASGQAVSLINGAQASNVVFVAGSSFTSVAPSTMNGNVLAAVSATLGGGTQNGRVLANTGAVTIATATTVVGGLPAFTPGEVAAGTNLSAEVVQIGGYGGTF
jgi:hypothetical protein